jgi:hypothetical protein
MLLCQKSYLYKNVSMLYDSNGFKPYIYIYILFFKTCPCATHIYILLAQRQNPLNINFSGNFRSSRNCRGNFHRTYLASRTCPGLRFPAYIRGLSAPLRTVSLFFSSTPSLAAAKGSLGDFGSSPPNHFRFLEI